MKGKHGASAQRQASRPDATPNRDDIQARAYYRYVARGRTDGQAMDDWLVAETELSQKRGSRTDSQ